MSAQSGKWTTGPWHVESCAESDCWCALIVADVEDEDGDKYIVSSGSLRKHNASLIAAAPDLYDVVRYAVDNPEFNPEALDKMARAALAKANGERE